MACRYVEVLSMLKEIKKLTRKRRKRQRGYSLIELVIVLVVTGIVLITTMPFFKASVKSYVNIRAGKTLQQAARIAFNRFLAELKLIESSLDIDYGYENEIRFDLPSQSNINYRLNGGILERMGKKLIDGVQTFQLRYFRENGSEKSPGFSYDSDIWRIYVKLVVGDEITALILEGNITPRNIHFD